MNSTRYAVKSLIIASFLHSVIAGKNDCCKSLKLSAKPDKYASPQLYVFGGWDGKTTTSASQFNSSVGEWEKTTSMSAARHRSCGTVDGTEIYLFGGVGPSEMAETAEVFDCETGVYSLFRSLPGNRYDCGAAVLDGYIYVVGGHDDATQLASGIRYNIQTTRRQKISPMHTARDGHQLVALSGRLYAVGGVSKTVEAYNATTDRWSTVASTQYEHPFAAATVHEEKIYVLSENGFEVYSPDRDEWESLTSPDNHRAKTLVSMNGHLWALSGDNHENNGTKLVHTYSTLTKKWSDHEAMDIARSYHLAFVVNH